MTDPSEQYILRVMRGEDRSFSAALFRAVLRTAEPLYSGIVTIRNRLFDAGLGVKRLPRPVISIGNLTAGGTGKTPVVHWLCEQLILRHRKPAVLLRGYKSVDGVSDEQRLLQSLLNPPGRAPVIVRANPDRFAGGSDVLREQPETDVFVLDDGFQHRNLARDFDLVLINAAEPFGFGHVHPRGLLREPLRGLGRADAVLITRADAATAAGLEAIEGRVRQVRADIPIYHASHALSGFRREHQMLPPDAIRGRRVYLFSGIGDPRSFQRQIEQLGAVLVAARSFPDHFAYTARDIDEIDHAAVGASAEMMLATEKDWTKLAAIPMARETTVPLWRSELRIDFRAGDEAELLAHVTGKTGLESGLQAL